MGGGLGGGIAGGAIGGIVGAAGSAITAAMSARQARKQRAWARKNYKHRFQWSVKDMRKAGINPILAAQSGLGGGGTPSGAAAQVPDFGKVGDQIISGVQKQAERKKMDVEKIAITELGKKHASDAAKARSDIAVNEDSQKLIMAQAGAADAQRNRTNTGNLIEAFAIGDAMLKNKIAGKQSTEMARTAAEWTPLINALSGVAGAWGFGRFLSRGANAATAAPTTVRTDLGSNVTRRAITPKSGGRSRGVIPGERKTFP